MYSAVSKTIITKIVMTVGGNVTSLESRLNDRLFQLQGKQSTWIFTNPLYTNKIYDMIIIN
jgi:hypothetical protein